jgi:raffinose/stachyose/melibiose transport system substrate-binding protein
MTPTERRVSRGLARLPRATVKHVAMGCAAALAATLIAACGSSSGGSAGSGGHITLTILFHSQDSPLQKAYERNVLISGFEKVHPNITVDATWTANPRDVIVQQLAAGGGPDILITDGSADVQYFAQQKQVLPLTKWESQYNWNTLYPSWAMPLLSFDGTMYAIPNKTDILVMYYNKAIFSQHGWAPPTTWSQLLQVSAEAKKAGLQAFALGTSDIPNANEWWITAAINDTLGAAGTKQLLSGQIPWNGPQVTSAITNLKTLWDDGYLNSGEAAGITLNEATSEFLDQKSAMLLEGTWELGSLVASPPGFDYGVLEIPAFSSSVQPDLPLAVGQTMLINKNTKNANAAAEFLAWVGSTENLNKALEPVGIPTLANLSIQNLAKVNPNYATVGQLYSSAASSGNLGYASWSYFPATLRTWMMTALDEVYDGQMTVQAYVNNLQSLYQASVANGSYTLFKNG